jgi:hypothetical protein
MGNFNPNSYTEENDLYNFANSLIIFSNVSMLFVCSLYKTLRSLARNLGELEYVGYHGIGSDSVEFCFGA